MNSGKISQVAARLCRRCELWLSPPLASLNTAVLFLSSNSLRQLVFIGLWQHYATCGFCPELRTTSTYSAGGNTLRLNALRRCRKCGSFKLGHQSGIAPALTAKVCDIILYKLTQVITHQALKRSARNHRFSVMADKERAFLPVVPGIAKFM